MQLLLIRHSITAGNLEHRYIGCRTDEPLCEAGIALAQQKSVEFRRSFLAPELVLVSPMQRCRQTAEILFPHMPQKSYGDYRSAISERSKGKIIRSCPVTRPIRRGSTAAVRWHFRRANPEKNLCGDAVRRWKRHCKAGRNLISQQ